MYGYLDGLAEKSVPQAAGPSSAEAGTILFHDDFSTGQLEGWKQWDDPKTKGPKGLWSWVVSEYSGIKNTLGKSSTLMTTGESKWANYAVEVELFRAGDDGYLDAKPGDRFPSGNHTGRPYRGLGFGIRQSPTTAEAPVFFMAGDSPRSPHGKNGIFYAAVA